MKIETRKLCYLCLFPTYFIFSSVSYAGNYSADFLSIGAGARALALGGAAITLTGDATGTYWNPASISYIKHNALSLMHAERFSYLEMYNFASVVSKIEPLGNFGISWIRLGIDDIPVYEELSGPKEERLANPDLQPSAEPEGYLQDIENALFLSYSRAVAEPILILNVPVTSSYGASVKYIFTRLGDKSCRGIGIDAGILLYAADSKVGSVSVGAVIQDVFKTTVKWNTNHEDIIPSNTKIGVAYIPSLNLLSKFTFMFDIENRYGWVVHAGLEFKPVDFLAIRAGLRDTGVTAGAGLRIKNFSVDYAFTGDDLANSHQLSLNALIN